MNKYATPDNFYNDWQTPPGKTKKTHVACHLALIEDFKTRHDNLINISRKKALTKHENEVVKAFFCGKTKFGHLAYNNQGEIKLTCPASEERLAGYEVKKRISPKWSHSKRRRVSSGYIDGAIGPED